MTSENKQVVWHVESIARSNQNILWCCHLVRTGSAERQIVEFPDKEKW